MPYSQKELKEIADKTDEDPTLLQATTVPGAAEFNEDGTVKITYTPVTLPDGESYVRRQDSTLDWKNYKFEMVMSDGTRHDFIFTAKDDGDAQKKVRERVAATQHQDGTFKLSRLEAPKDLDVGKLGGGDGAKTVASSDKAPKADKAGEADEPDKNETGAAKKAPKK